jgi:chromosome segregation ATPase
VEEVSEPEMVVEPEPVEPADQEPEPVEAESFGTEREPDPTAVPADAELAELTAELRALREIAGRADALAVSVGNRIGGLEEAAGCVDRLEHERDERDERIARLQRDLDAAKATSVELEGRLSGVGDAAEELNAATETLRQLQQALEQTAR